MKTYAQKQWGDCSAAVAYSLNFVQMCYMSDCADLNEFYNEPCPYCEKKVQNNDFVYSKSRFSKKDYFILDTYDYGVSETLKNDMVFYGVSDDNFRPIFSSKDRCVLGYQITPNIVLPSLTNENGYQEISHCKICGNKNYELQDEIYYFSAYKRLGYPEYINNEALIILNEYHIAKTAEIGNVFISIELYNALIKKYPRLECPPYFLEM